MTDEGSGLPQAKRKKLSPPPANTRSIAACQRCRLKKIKCDQNFPKCSKCAKAHMECVVIDPATGREVSRSYVFHLEEKVQLLEQKLKLHGLGLQLDSPQPGAKIDRDEVPFLPSSALPLNQTPLSVSEISELKLTQPYLGASLGISFAKLMMTAVKMNNSLLTMRQEPLALTISVGQEVVPATLPPKSTAQHFISIYFSQSNPQLPILHRESFLKWIFEPVYGPWDTRISLASRYSEINMDVYGPSTISEENTWFFQYKQILSRKLADLPEGSDHEVEMAHISYQIVVPPEYHRPMFFLNMVFAIASSVYHLQYFSGISEQFKKTAVKYVDATCQTADPLGQLEAILLLSVYSIMRPSVPGVWYVLGTALRICVDLGLHTDGLGKSDQFDAFTKDRGRRLFWCTYSLDRQICFYLGRPVGIPDESVTTKYPSELDDAFILESESNLVDYSDQSNNMPSYKSISISFFKIRRIQLEVQRILYENGEIPRRFVDLDHWRQHIHDELELWRNSTPKSHRQMNCDFNVEFFTLNYNHTLLSLNGLSPRTFKLTVEAYHKVLEALKNLMACYTQLFQKKAINYTWAAVHNLFIAGTSYLFSLYNSREVRRHNSHFEVKKITEECISVLKLLVTACEAAQSCADTFQVLTAAVLKLCYDEVVEGTLYGRSEMVIPPDAVKELLNGLTRGNLANLVEGLAEASAEEFYNSARFEWVSQKTHQQEGNCHVAETPNPVEVPSLNTFFLELANLSPASSVRDHSDALSVLGGFGVEPLDFENRREKQVHPKDGKRVFEMIQLMPGESIWDQFFALPNTASTIPSGSPQVKTEPAASPSL